MKRIVIMIPVLAIAAMFNTAAFSSDTESTMGTAKNECLLASLECHNSMDTFQQRIDKLQAEINKGTAVYTPGEIHILQDKLIDAQRSLDKLEYDQ